MFTKLTHTALIVADQEKALQFWVEKLGFEKRDDNPMGPGQRWLTIGCKEQPAVEIILQAPDWGMDGRTPAERKARIGKQEGFAFASSDIQADYKKMQEQGIETLGTPEKMPWGTQLLFKDLDGNTHLLVG